MGQSIRTFSGGTILLAILTAIVALSAAPAAARPGDLDPSFGGDGIATTSVGRMGGAPYAVAVQDDGKVILAGTIGPVDGAFALLPMRRGADTRTTSCSHIRAALIWIVAASHRKPPSPLLLCRGFSTPHERA